MRREHEGKSYITSYYTKTSNVLIQMYCAAKVDTAEDLRVGLIHFMSVMRRNILEEIHKRGDNYEVDNPPYSSPSTGECARSCTPHPILIMGFLGPYLPWNGILRK